MNLNSELGKSMKDVKNYFIFHGNANQNNYLNKPSSLNYRIIIIIIIIIVVVVVVVVVVV